jgi:predicted nucleic acid-binding protein
MRLAVLADTGPLYALVDPSDQYHARAQREVKRLGGEQRGVLVAYPVLMESYTLIVRRLGWDVARKWLEETRAGAGMITPTARDYEAAIRRVQSQPEKTVTLFDALLAALSEHLRVPVWTYDRHFELMRVSVWR